MESEPLTAERLREAHATLSHAFDELVRVTESGDRAAYDAAWDDFWHAVEAHLAFEERELFPVLIAEGPDGQEHARRLAGEHATIRRDLIDIGVSLQLRADRAESIQTFVRDMRQHAAHEDAWLHPAAERMAAHRAAVSVRVGLLTGAATGSLLGSIAGPPGLVAGAAIGGAIGAAAGRAMTVADDDKTARDETLDETIGISGGHIGEASPNAPKARIGAFSAAACGAGSGADEAEDAEGPIPSAGGQG